MTYDVVERSIAELRAALESGETTAAELVDAYLARIDAYDAPGTETALNAVVVRNPQARAEAAASDDRRARGAVLGPLDGIPYTAKDSYLVRGLTAASGSPAFAELVAQRDAFTIERLRAAGAICLGLTNMPPMANGGMQRGVYGRAESPYNAGYLTAPFASGSSNGSGTATAASLALHTQMALISSSRVNCSPGSSQIWLPPILKACSLMGTISVMEIFPASTASSVSSSVMILVIDAMGTSASGSFSGSGW